MNRQQRRAARSKKELGTMLDSFWTMTEKELLEIFRTVIRGDDLATAVFNALRDRGMPKTEAEMEVGRALIGCLWETWHGMPDRWQMVLKLLSEGRSSAELFPDELYDKRGARSPN